MKLLSNTIAILLVSLIYGCSLNSYTNIKPTGEYKSTKASFDIKTDRGNKNKTLFILSLSGGGSRAAYYSSEVMLALEDVFVDEGVNLLEEVDVISSVSGGSLPAAYYAISKDPDDESGNVVSNRNWDDETVRDLMSRNYRAKWFLNWFWPENIVKYWFTDFDRSDIMAQTFADNLFDRKIIGIDLKFKDINPSRPNIILNATDGTSENRFGNVFTFTDSSFNEIHSDISEYQISRAVMATASFPAVFNYMTLKNYKELDNDSYVHIFDGGNTDNLGLKSVIKIIDKNKTNFERIVVVLVDAYAKSKGVGASKSDARNFLDYGVDLNFIDCTDSLLANNRNQLISDLRNELSELPENYQYAFYHIKFENASNELKLNSIPTDFKLNESAIIEIEKAVKEQIHPNNICLVNIKNILLYDHVNVKNTLCPSE